jgi:hypothetical protein
VATLRASVRPPVQPGERVDRVRAEGVLDPGRPVRGEGLEDPGRGRAVPETVQLDHEVHPVAEERLAEPGGAVVGVQPQQQQVGLDGGPQRLHGDELHEPLRVRAVPTGSEATLPTGRVKFPVVGG